MTTTTAVPLRTPLQIFGRLEPLRNNRGTRLYWGKHDKVDFVSTCTATEPITASTAAEKTVPKTGKRKRNKTDKPSAAGILSDTTALKRARVDALSEQARRSRDEKTNCANELVCDFNVQPPVVYMHAWANCGRDDTAAAWCVLDWNDVPLIQPKRWSFANGKVSARDMKHDGRVHLERWLIGKQLPSSTDDESTKTTKTVPIRVHFKNGDPLDFTRKNLIVHDMNPDTIVLPPELLALVSKFEWHYSISESSSSSILGVCGRGDTSGSTFANRAFEWVNGDAAKKYKLAAWIASKLAAELSTVDLDQLFPAFSPEDIQLDCDRLFNDRDDDETRRHGKERTAKTQERLEAILATGIVSGRGTGQKILWQCFASALWSASCPGRPAFVDVWKSENYLRELFTTWIALKCPDFSVTSLQKAFCNRFHQPTNFPPGAANDLMDMHWDELPIDEEDDGDVSSSSSSMASSEIVHSYTCPLADETNVKLVHALFQTYEELRHVRMDELQRRVTAKQVWYDAARKCAVVAHVYARATAPAAAGDGHICQIAVDRSMQRRGYARDLMKFIICELESVGCRNIWLSVRQSNVAAIGLYTTLEFKHDSIVSWNAGKLVGCMMKYTTVTCPESETTACLSPSAGTTLVEKPLHVLDCCHGFGGRLLGFLASRRTRQCPFGSVYVGIDPNSALRGCMRRLLEILDPQATFIESDAVLDARLTDKRRVVLIRGCAEDPETWRTVQRQMGVWWRCHLFLTSPPYFDTELYSSEPTQSMTRHPTLDKWTQEFLLPAMRYASQWVASQGVMLVNIKQGRTWNVSVTGALCKLMHTELGFSSVFFRQERRQRHNQSFMKLRLATRRAGLSSGLCADNNEPIFAFRAPEQLRMSFAHAFS